MWDQWAQACVGGRCRCGRDSKKNAHSDVDEIDQHAQFLTRRCKMSEWVKLTSNCFLEGWETVARPDQLTWRSEFTDETKVEDLWVCGWWRKKKEKDFCVDGGSVASLYWEMALRKPYCLRLPFAIIARLFTSILEISRLSSLLIGQTIRK